MWAPGQQRGARGATGKPADGRRCRPSSVTVGPCSVPKPLSRGSIDSFDPAPISSIEPRSEFLKDDLPLFSWEAEYERTVEMIPDTESVCRTSEAAVRSTDVCQKIRTAPEGETASVTAWKRYQQLVAVVESRGGKFNRKSMIEAIFRGNDLVYASH